MTRGAQFASESTRLGVVRLEGRDPGSEHGDTSPSGHPLASGLASMLGPTAYLDIFHAHPDWQRGVRLFFVPFWQFSQAYRDHMSRRRGIGMDSLGRSCSEGSPGSPDMIGVGGAAIHSFATASEAAKAKVRFPGVLTRVQRLLSRAERRRVETLG